MQSQPSGRHIKTSVSKPMGEHMAYLNYRMAMCHGDMIEKEWKYN